MDIIKANKTLINDKFGLKATDKIEIDIKVKLPVKSKKCSVWFKYEGRKITYWITKIINAQNPNKGIPEIVKESMLHTHPTRSAVKRVTAVPMFDCVLFITKFYYKTWFRGLFRWYYFYKRRRKWKRL